MCPQSPDLNNSLVSINLSRLLASRLSDSVVSSFSTYLKFTRPKSFSLYNRFELGPMSLRVVPIIWYVGGGEGELKQFCPLRMTVKLTFAGV